ncbi:MAG: sigma-70 family RNA polymerase sigma factor, partial [Clostridia bacterium]|nr:sigma-70 family RNA polymerase sigma factor [Clostridia bacterium]
YNLIRKNQKEAPAEVLSAVSADTDAEARYIYLEALSTLSDKEREVIVLKVYCKCKHKEIAEILDITAAASEKLYQRGVGKLKKYYD